MASRREVLAASGRTVVFVAVDGSAAALIAMADAPRDTDAAAVAALHDSGVRVVILTGDNDAVIDAGSWLPCPRAAHRIAALTMSGWRRPGT